MHRLTILYATPEDPAAFRSYYETTHVPVARAMEGLTAWNLSWLDPADEYVLVADLYAETSEAMDEILDSPGGRAASADLDNFVTAPVTFLRGDEVAVTLA